MRIRAGYEIGFEYPEPTAVVLTLFLHPSRLMDIVNRHIRFDYMLARANRSATEAYREAVGVCRDYTHLAIAFCRIMNIPARYCTGYLGDIGVPAALPMDFSAWFEVFLGGRWHT